MRGFLQLLGLFALACAIFGTLGLVAYVITRADTVRYQERRERQRAQRGRDAVSREIGK